MNPYLEHAIETIAIQVELMQEEAQAEALAIQIELMQEESASEDTQ
jgi:hypothetical protein